MRCRMVVPVSLSLLKNIMYRDAYILPYPTLLAYHF